MEITRTVNENGTIVYTNEKGQLHREDGPAVVWPNGDELYFLNRIGYSKENYEKEVIKLKLKRIIDL
jgi:hypothetical protein